MELWYLFPSVILRIILSVFLSMVLSLIISRQKKKKSLIHYSVLSYWICLSFVAGVQYCDTQTCMHSTSDANTLRCSWWIDECQLYLFEVFENFVLFWQIFCFCSFSFSWRSPKDWCVPNTGDISKKRQGSQRMHHIKPAVFCSFSITWI